VGGRTVLQMDEAAPEDQILLGNQYQRGQGTDLLCDHRILPCRDHREQIEVTTQDLRNITDIEHIPTRQNPCKRDTYGIRLQRCQRTRK